YGVPLDALVRKFAHQRFEPSGFTKNPELRNAFSITDYVFRWMALQFIPGYREANAPNRNQPELAIPGLLEELKKKVNRPVPELRGKPGLFVGPGTGEQESGHLPAPTSGYRTATEERAPSDFYRRAVTKPLHGRYRPLQRN